MPNTWQAWVITCVKYVAKIVVDSNLKTMRMKPLAILSGGLVDRQVLHGIAEMLDTAAPEEYFCTFS